jgi:hypothetical protein
VDWTLTDMSKSNLTSATEEKKDPWWWNAGKECTLSQDVLHRKKKRSNWHINHGDSSSDWSDWTILVSYDVEKEGEDGVEKEGEEDDVVKEGENNEIKLETITDRYCVNRKKLSCGERSSGYFERLFESDFSEVHTRESKIKLHELTAKAFPQMLNFINGDSKDEFLVDTDTVTALYPLGMYFEIPSLCLKCKEFLLVDLEPDKRTQFRHIIPTCIKGAELK